MTDWLVTIAFRWDDQDDDPRAVFYAWTRIRRRIIRTMKKLGLRWVSTSWDPRH